VLSAAPQRNFVLAPSKFLTLESVKA
jgi:hypothetical protein